jgi:hypothetical protein
VNQNDLFKLHDADFLDDGKPSKVYLPIEKLPRYNEETHGAVTVSTGWRTLRCDAGREGVHSRKSRLKKIDANNIVSFARKAAPVAA